MSGVGEAATIIGLIAGTIEVVKSTKSLYYALKDSKGQPKQFSKIAARFPLLLEILRNAEKNAQPTKLNDGQRKEVENIIEGCKDKVQMLNKIFDAVLRGDNDNWMDRLKKAVAALGRGKRVEELMREIMEDIELVTCDKLLGTATRDEIERLQKAIQEMIDMPPSIPDDGGSITQHNSGGGNNTASRVTNNNIGEGTYTNSNTGGAPQLNHNGPGIFYYNNNGSEKSTSLLQSLYFPEMDSHRNDISKTDVRNTCKWIYEEKDYKDWLALRQKLLWIVGIPGSGKSTIMNYIYRQDTSRTKPNEGTEESSKKAPKTLIVASFFCYSTGALIQKSRAGLFRSLLHQILRQIPTPPPEVTLEFNKKCELQGEHEKKWDWHEHDLEEMLQTSISHIAKKYPDNYALRIYVDALDEFSSNEPNSSKEPRVLAKFFQGLVSEIIVGIDVNICISCRDYPFIAKEGLKVSIGKKNHRDISAYVQTELSGTFGESEGARELMHWIATKASGIFQWAVVVVEKAQEIDEDMGTKSPKRILKQLEHLPQGLDKLYEKSFQTIERPRRLQSLRLLRWICFAERPLSVKELYYAMASDPSMPWSKTVDCDINEKENAIKSFSCNLAVINHHRSYSEVQPRHQSVYDYLVSGGLRDLDNNVVASSSLPSSVIGHAHFQLSRYCVKFLSSKKLLTKCHDLKLRERAKRIIAARRCRRMFQGAAKKFEDEFPFFCYAVSSWAYHANMAEEENPDEEDMLEFYQELINIPFEKLDQVRIWVDYQRDLGPTTLLHIASERHLTRLVELILNFQNNLKNANIADGIRQYEMPDIVGINMAIHGRRMHETPLQLAVHNGHDDVVELLLQHSNIDVNVQNRHGDTALLYAVRRRHEGIVRMLLQHSNTDVNIQNNYGDTALLYAVQHEYEVIVRILLQHSNIDVSTQNIYYETPLFDAIKLNNERIVRMLLQYSKIDVNLVTGNLGKTLLFYTIQQKHKGIATIRLQLSKLDINAQKNDRETPLFYAIRLGNEGIIRMLLQYSKIDVNGTGNFGETQMFYAVQQKHKGRAAIFLQHSTIDINAQNAYGETALLYAVRHEHEGIVRMLLQYSKIDVNATSHFGKTPLFYAVQQKNEEIAVMLLQHRKIDVNVKNVFHRTVLSLAAEEGLEGIVRVLLETRKADVEISLRNWRLSPLTVAIEREHWTIVELLLNLRGRMSKADKRVARALEKLSPYERNKMNWPNFVEEIIARDSS